MKFQLSTVLLGVGLIGVSVGWIVDRENWNAERLDFESAHQELVAAQEEHIDRVAIAVGIDATAETTFRILDEILKTDDQSSYAKTQAILQLIEILENRSDVEKYGALPARISHAWAHDARSLAREALYILDCDSPEEFFEIAKWLDDFRGRSSYTEINDPDSEEYKALYKFVSDGIEYRSYSFGQPIEQK